MMEEANRFKVFYFHWNPDRGEPKAIVELIKNKTYKSGDLVFPNFNPEKVIMCKSYKDDTPVTLQDMVTFGREDCPPFTLAIDKEGNIGTATCSSKDIPNKRVARAVSAGRLVRVKFGKRYKAKVVGDHVIAIGK